MAYGKKKLENAPYETLSDLAIGSLGVFLILVVVIVVISSLHSSGTSDVFEKIKSENNYFRSQIVKVKKESSNYKSNDFAKKEIRLIRREYDKISRKLDRSREKLLFEKELVKKKAEKFGEVNAAIDVLDQQKKESANLIIEMDKLKAQLESLVDIETGSGVDRTGTPYFTYGTGASTSGDSLFLIGDSASLTIPQFLAFLNSVKNHGKDKDGFSTFFYQFSSSNSVWLQDSYKPLWVWSKTGFVEAKVRRKY